MMGERNRDPLRGTGRTTRMLTKALVNFYRYAFTGRHVLVIFANFRECIVGAEMLCKIAMDAGMNVDYDSRFLIVTVSGMADTTVRYKFSPPMDRNLHVLGLYADRYIDHNVRGDARDT